MRSTRVRRWSRALVMTTVAATAALRGEPRTADAECKRKCDAGEARDAHGCCRPTPAPSAAPSPPGAPSPSPSSPPPAPSPPPSLGPCPAGMVRIPGGGFWMGSAETEGKPSERPRHRVTVGTFCLDRTEVTVSAFAACTTAGGCAAAPTTVRSPDYDAAHTKFWSGYCNAGKADRADHPVNCVDWNDATVYCRWAGKRLPTEQEWEYAARGPEGRKYPWGAEPPTPDRLNACGLECHMALLKVATPGPEVLFDGLDGAETTAKVGSYPRGATPLGLLDMAGNVWEWTASNACSYDGNGCLALRIARGGGWREIHASVVRGASRSSETETTRVEIIGFRCAR